MTFQIKMTVEGEEECPFLVSSRERYTTDADLSCLDCVLDEHIDNAPPSCRHGSLEIEKSDDNGKVE